MGSENESSVCQIVPDLRSPARRITKHNGIPGLKSPARRAHSRVVINSELSSTRVNNNTHSGLLFPSEGQRPTLQAINLNVERTPIRRLSPNNKDELPSPSKVRNRFMTPERCNEKRVLQVTNSFYTPPPSSCCLSTGPRSIMKPSHTHNSPTRFIKSPKKKVTFNPLQDCICVIKVESDSKPGMAESIERKAIRLGSKISKVIHENVTHIIFRQSGKDHEINQAKLNGIVCVSPRWIIECEEKMRRLDEEAYLIGD